MGRKRTVAYESGADRPLRVESGRLARRKWQRRVGEAYWTRSALDSIKTATKGGQWSFGGRALEARSNADRR